MKKTIVVWALMLIALVLIFVPLYAIKDSHYGVSNVCNEILYPDICK
jgi:uncharacterized membrane protein YvbJ